MATLPAAPQQPRAYVAGLAPGGWRACQHGCLLNELAPKQFSSVAENAFLPVLASFLLYRPFPHLWIAAPIFSCGNTENTRHFPHWWITQVDFQLLGPVFRVIPPLFHGVFHSGFVPGMISGITWGKHCRHTGISGAEVFLVNPEATQGKTGGDKRG
ncbi:hypothetical protein [Hymenobacter daeguensis]